MEALKKSFTEHVRNLQIEIIEQMKKLDPSIEIEKDLWSRKDKNGDDGGGGITCALRGDIFENAGVNTSIVHGLMDPSFGKQILRESNVEGEEKEYRIN